MDHKILFSHSASIPMTAENAEELKPFHLVKQWKNCLQIWQHLASASATGLVFPLNSKSFKRLYFLPMFEHQYHITGFDNLSEQTPNNLIKNAFPFYHQSLLCHLYFVKYSTSQNWLKNSRSGLKKSHVQRKVISFGSISKFSSFIQFISCVLLCISQRTPTLLY